MSSGTDITPEERAEVRSKKQREATREVLTALVPWLRELDRRSTPPTPAEWVLRKHLIALKETYF